MVPVTSIYAAILAAFFVALSTRTIRARRGARIAVGTGADEMLLRASRAHANFAEYVPFALLLMGLGELNGAPWWLVAALGIALVIGRFSHAYGISRTPEVFAWRVRGMVLTFGVLAVASLVAAGFGIVSLT